MYHKKPYQFSNKSASNRLVLPPMASGLATIEGLVTAAQLQHYKRLTQAKPGILFVEYTFVHESGRSEPNQLGIQSDAHIHGLRKIANTIKESGALAGIQLTHSGGKSSRELTGGEMLGAGNIPVPTINNDLESPRSITIEEIPSFQDWFVQAADRAQKAGFDIIELHAAHGYGLNQWLSPITNNRNDIYGGSLTNRSRMLLEIVQKIKQRLPRLTLAVRMPGQDLLPGGITIGEMQTLAKELVSIGVELLDVSSGLGGWRRPRDRRGEGYLIPEAQAIQSVTEAPVIGVGGIRTMAFIEEQLSENRVSFAAIGRAFLENPLHFTI